MYPWNENQPPEYRPKITSVYQPNSLQDGVIVPGLQAGITGGVCGVAAAAITAWFDLPFWAIGGTTAAVAMAGAWLSYRSRWQWLLEKITGADLNADGFVGEPTQPTAPVLPLPPIRVELASNNGHSVDFIDLPVKPEKLSALARGLLAGRSFNQTAWTGSAGIFSRSEFDALRDTMIERGLLAWRNPESKAQGCDLTAAGRAVMRRLADLPPTLPPGQDS
jgi:hypothetical protein